MRDRIVITIPANADDFEIAEYIEQVCIEVGKGFNSGHVDYEHHWTFAGSSDA